MTDTLDETAQQIADRGRDALIARLRPAFQEAAAAHSDVLDLAPDQLEAMVERAVERADGLQWRRALASVATEQLGISLGEALAHPAVARAQELVGAPSYEESLAQLGPLPGAAAQRVTEPEAPPVPKAEAPPVPKPKAPPVPKPKAPPVPKADAPPVPEAVAPEDELDAPPGTGVEGTDDDELSSSELGVPAPEVDDEPAGPDVGSLAPPPPSAEEPTEATRVAEEDHPEPAAQPPDAAEDVGAAGPALPFAEHDADAEPFPDAEHGDADEHPAAAELPPSTAEYEALGLYEDDVEYEEGDDHALRVAVIHLGGIANLAPSERNIELQMSEDGLDIVRGGGEILGRLDWDQVKALEVPEPRGRRRMRRGGSTHLIVRTARGDASFEVPEVTPPELQQHLAPIVARHIRAD